MEQEIKKDKTLRSTFKKKISLFKRRKRSEIRPFVQESRNKKFRKSFLNIILIFGLIFIFCSILVAIRFWALPEILKSQNKSILSPIDQSLSRENVIRDLKKSGLVIDNIEISSDLTTATFKFRGSISVIIDPRQKIGESLKLLKTIDSELSGVNKKALYIDLRYNKPIVRLQ